MKVIIEIVQIDKLFVNKKLYVKKTINCWSKNFGYQESESESFRFSPGWSPGTHIILLLTDRLEKME